MTVETRAYDDQGEPVAVMVARGLHDVATLIRLLSTDGHRHSHVSKSLRQKVRRHNAGQAALRFLAEHGGSDFTAGWLTDDQLAPLGVVERAGLPVQHHLPVFSVGRARWECRVCWNVAFPCPPAQLGGRVLADHFGLPVVP